jgi:hypothetical protein
MCPGGVVEAFRYQAFKHSGNGLWQKQYQHCWAGLALAGMDRQCLLAHSIAVASVQCWPA